MGRSRHLNLTSRTPNRLQHTNSLALSKRAKHGVPFNKRARIVEQSARLPFMPPEDWHEPREGQSGFRIVVQQPGQGYRHILTPDDVRARLAALPVHFTRGLEVVQFSRMTRKKQSFPCYGMQWGTAIYLYPMEETLVEYHTVEPKPTLFHEARMYGGRWEQDADQSWKLIWTEGAIRDFYLNNILIHELGHLVDVRNTRYQDRERYAEWFALEHGYRSTRRAADRRPIVRRHDRKRSAMS